MLLDLALFSFAPLPAWTQQQKHLGKVCSCRPGCCGCSPGAAAVIPPAQPESSPQQCQGPSKKLFPLARRRHNSEEARQHCQPLEACLLAEAEHLIPILGTLELRREFWKVQRCFKLSMLTKVVKWKRSNVHHINCVLHLLDSCKLNEMQCIHLTL